MIAAQAIPPLVRLNLRVRGETLALEAWKLCGGNLAALPRRRLEPLSGDVLELERELGHELTQAERHELVHAYRSTLHNANLEQEVTRLRGSR